MDYIPFGLLLVLSLSSNVHHAESLSPPLFLTPLINQNKTDYARNISKVNSSLFLNVSSNSGFLTVDERYNSSTFFWYFPVTGKQLNETPWIIWLQGGPGASSLVGLFEEIGPFEYEHEKGLKLRNHSWAKEYSMVFLDNPVGAGYSFTESEQGFAQNMTMYSNNLFTALQQLVLLFPELRKAPLFIAGESYAGRYVSALATNILEHGKLLDVNLQGLILGNPMLNHEDTANYSAIFHQWGLIDILGLQAAQPLQDQYLAAIRNGSAALAYQLREKLLNQLQDLTQQKTLYNILVDDYQLNSFTEFLDSDEIKEAIHVGDRAFTLDNDTIKDKLAGDFLSNVQQEIEGLLDHYRVLIYCGQLDLISACVPNEDVRRTKWRWSQQSEFMKAPRVPWWRNGTLAGFVKSGGQLTEALVRGAGHLVPIDKPAAAFELISDFINKKDTETLPTYPPNPPNTSDVLNHDKTVNTTSTVVSTTATPIIPVNKTQPNNKTAETVNQNKNNSLNGTAPATTKLMPNTNETASTNTGAAAVATNKSQNTTTNNVVPIENNLNKTVANNPAGSKTAESNPSVKNKNAEPLKQATSESGTSAGTVTSIVLNVLLVLALIGGALIYYRQRRRTADFFYSNVETNSDDIFLT